MDRLSEMGGRRLQRLAAYSVVFHYARRPAYWGTFPRIARALDARDGESLLDVGCGTGMGARLCRRYVGIDTELPMLRFARRRLQRNACGIVGMSGLDLGFRAGAFDKAVLINVVHHLDDPEVDRLLAELGRVVRQRIVVLDADPDSANRASRFFLAHDRGRHIRRRDELRSLLARHHHVVAEETFHNTLRIVSQVLFTLLPRSSGGDHVGIPDQPPATASGHRPPF